MRGAQNYHNRVGPYHFRIRRAGGSGARLAAPGAGGSVVTAEDREGPGFAAPSCRPRTRFTEGKEQWLFNG